jgi:hypothetical protein
MPAEPWTVKPRDPFAAAAVVEPEPLDIAALRKDAQYWRDMCEQLQQRLRTFDASSASPRGWALDSKTPPLTGVPLGTWPGAATIVATSLGGGAASGDCPPALTLVDGARSKTPRRDFGVDVSEKVLNRTPVAASDCS